MQGDGFLDGQVFDGPAVELDEAAETGDRASGGDNMGMGVAVGSGHGDEFAVGVDGDPRADIGRIFPDFRGVAGGPECVDFQQTQDGGGSDQSGEDALTAELHDGVGLVGESGPDFLDASIADEHRGVGQHRTRCREDPAVLQQDGGGLGRQNCGGQSEGQTQAIHASRKSWAWGIRGKWGLCLVRAAGAVEPR